MPISLVDPKSGQVYEAADEQTAQAQIRAYGLEPASQEQVAAYDLQKQHGGEKLRTVRESALAEGAQNASRLSQFAGDVDAMGNPINTVPRVPAEAFAPSAFTPDAQARRAANPISAGVGKGAADLPAYAALGTASALTGGAVAEGLGASALLGGAAGVLSESAVTGAAQEAQEAAEGNRPFSADGALHNGILNVAFAGLGLGLGVAFRSVTGRATGALAETAERAIQRRAPGALAQAGEALADPAVAARSSEVVGQRIDSTMSRLDEALAQAKPPVANDPRAQREALRGLAETLRDAQPELAQQLEELAGRPRQQRFLGLLDLESSNPNVSSALDELRGNAALWGDKAVAHGQAVSAARAAREGSPGAFLDALRPIEDPKVRSLAADLSQHLDDAGGIEAARNFAETRSVGAAGNGPEVMPAEEVQYFVKNDDEIVDNMRTVAGGGPGEKGAFQDFNEAFRDVTSNRIKRQDFAAAAPADEATRAALLAERDAIADSLHGVTAALGQRGANKKVALLNTHLRELRAAPVEEVAGILDRTKQVLDDLHMKAIVDKTDPYGEMLGAVDPVVERIRGTLENPAYVGDKIAELQQVRNAAWSDKDTGFIRNMQIANETGVKLFKRIDRDYHTGDLVMQFDPGAFKSLIALDAHESKPVLESWAKVLDSAERMGANTVEVGAESAGRSPVGKLQRSIDAIREIFETQDKRIAARDLARPGQEFLSRAESLPGIGTAVRGAKAVFGKERVEAFAAGTGSKYVPVKVRSVAKARAALKRTGTPPRTTVAEPPAPPTPSGPGPSAPGAIPLRKTQPPDVGGGVEAPAAAERLAANARDVRVRTNGELGPASSAAAAKLEPEFRAAADTAIAGKSLEDLRALPLDESDRATVDSLKADDHFRSTGNVRESFGKSRAGLPQIAIEADGTAYLRNGRHRLAAAQELGLNQITARVMKYDRAGNTLWEAEMPVRVAGRRASRAKVAGSAEVAALGGAAAVGAAGLGAYKAAQLAQSPEETERDQSLALLEQQAAQDLDDTARALTDPAYASRWARQSRELPATLESFQGVHSTLQQAYADRREAILRAAQDPDALVEHMTEALGFLPAEVGLKAFQVAQYLAAKLPPLRGVTVARPNGLPPSQLEMRRWALQYQTALDPSTAFDDAKRGRLRHEQVEVLKDLWPDRYDALRTATLLAVGDGKSSVGQRQRADLLFGFAEQLDPAFSRRLSGAAAQAYAARGQEQRGQRAPGKTRIPGSMTPGGINALQLGASAPLGQ